MQGVSLRMTPTMLHSIDNQGRIEEVSDLWLSRLGYTADEVIGRPSTDFLSEPSARYARDVVLPVFFQTGTCDVEYDMRRKDGTLVPVRLRGIAVHDGRGAFVRSIAVIEDLTEQRALEQKMLASQKLEGLGHMAGNIAHDFNNLLASIVGNAQLALKHAGHIPAAVSSLALIMTASERAADLCRQLLAYSGRGRFQIEQIDLDVLAREMVDVLQINVRDRAQVELDLAAAGARLHVDATQLRQVLMNLVINASEAFGDRSGTIRIATSIQDLDAAAIADSSRPDAPPGRYAALEVTDDGNGMPAGVLARIFDPFFTTKGTGRGLGLAAVHGIVHGHRGTMKVRTEPGRGTMFSIFLPADAAPAPRTRAATPTPPRGTVLVVDDDDLLRSTLANQLAAAGYYVEVAATAARALELAQTATFGAFLIDVTMPDLSGPDLARRLRQHAPSARFVLMSGYDDVDLTASTRARFLRKPFTEAQLLAMIGPTER